MQSQTIATSIHGRFLIERGSECGESPPLLVGFHGYGESAEQHLGQLCRIPGAKGWQVIAVSALHRFYDRRSRQVVASWMTSQNRELMISDNLSYVASVIDLLRSEHGAGEQLVFAGFSQGVAMAYRAAALGRHVSQGLIVLAGDVPPDVARSHPYLPPVLIGRGTADQWYTESKMSHDLGVLKQLGANVESCVFAAGHEWAGPFREAAAGLLGRVELESETS